MLTVDDFTIGWICGLPAELVAAKSLFDELYETPPVPHQDSNFYTVGRIAQHRVVIACLLHGEYGTNPTATVASHMLRTFRNIKFGLLVGIGSGAPSLSHDIRLGDVVISRPGRNHTGVVQFALDNLASGRGLVLTGALNNPPSELLRASAALESYHKREEPKFVEYVSKLAARYPDSEDIWSPPGTQHDMLYSSGYEHSEDHDDCSQCDADHVVARAPRTSTTPQVHYGLIASGNAVIKHGETRDRMSQEHGILCFEMEAAGLMDDFPCLVIRGICDYADSHKNKNWQRYAASVAAAYAKELLQYVDPVRIGSTVPAIDFLDLDVSENKEEELASTSSATAVDDSDNEVINKAAERVAEALASDKRLKALCMSCASRMTAPMFQRRIIPILFRYGASMKKSADTPLGQALAFLIRHRKQLISFSIRKIIFPSQSEVVDEGSQFEKMSEDETERLRHLIKSRFAAPQFEGAQQPHLDEAEVEAVEGVDDAVPEEETADMASSLAEADLDNIASVLCSGEPYWEAYQQLKSVAFPAPIQELTRVLQRHISNDGSPYLVSCLIEWEVLEFIESEEIMVNELDSIFTLTGTFDRAAAYRLGDYMRRKWHSGDATLNAFKKLVAPQLSDDKDEVYAQGVGTTLAPNHEFHIQVTPDTESEQMLLQVKGNFDQICETLEQFSWLATTLRPGTGGMLTVSEIKFQLSDPSEKLFRLSLLEQSNDRKPDPNEAGQCWTSLFTESNLAYGFSLCDDNRPDEMLGLEIPFLPMAAFAGVKYPVDFAGRTVLAGPSTLLTPTVSVRGSIQWHYSRGKDRFDSCKQYVKVLDPALQTMAWDELAAARTFLGFGSNAEILLGTKYGTDVSESKVPRAGGKLSIATEGPITMEVSARGVFKVGLSGVWKAARAGERAQLEAQQRTLIDCIRPCQYAPALLYDYEAARAFLVPELSVILHMASAYLRTCSSLPIDQIPCAEPCPNSGEAAFRVVEQEQNLAIPFQIGESRKYRDIIHDFVTIWEQRKLQTSVSRQAELDLRINNSIRGWDFVDMQGKLSEFYEREISTNKSFRRAQPIWWKMFAKQPCMVIFGGNIGCPIRKIAHEINQPYCNAWADIPTGKHLLLANASSFSQLRTICCSQFQPSNKHRHYHMITGELAWARPKGSTLFEPCTQGDSCTPVQTMSKIGRWHQWNESHERKPGDTAYYQNGAILFADDPKDFAPRPCSFVLPDPPDPGPPNPPPANIRPVNICIICYILAGCFGFVYILSIL